MGRNCLDDRRQEEGGSAGACICVSAGACKYAISSEGRWQKVGSECMAGGGVDVSKMDERWTVIDTGRGGENMGRGKS